MTHAEHPDKIFTPAVLCKAEAPMRRHTHTRWFLWFMGTLHRCNGFYTEQTVFSITYFYFLTITITHTHALTHTHSHARTRTLTHTHTHALTDALSHSHTHTHTHTHTQTLSLSHSHTHTHTHTHAWEQTPPDQSNSTERSDWLRSPRTNSTRFTPESKERNQKSDFAQEHEACEDL